MFTKIDKAFTAAITAGVGIFLALGTTDEPIRFGAAVGGGIVAGVLTWWVPNKKG